MISNCGVVSNCGTPTESVSMFLNSEFKSVIREGWLYVKDW